MSMWKNETATCDVTAQLLDGDQVCPVIKKKNDAGGYNYTAYLIGQVDSLKHYVSLVDILHRANSNDVVVVNIDSPGGYVTTGAMIASAIHHSAAQVYTNAKGFCASAAALIHSSAKKECIHASRFAVMMYHTSSGGEYGYSTKVANNADNMVKYVNTSLLSQALEYGHITQTEFDDIQSGAEIFISGAEFNRRNNGEKPTQYDNSPADDNTDVIPAVTGNESLDDVASWYYKKNTTMQNDRMGGRVALVQKPEPQHFVFTSDSKGYRIYLQPEIMWTPEEVRTLCKFLDSLDSSNTVTMYLGGDGDDINSYLVGAVLDSWENCLATTIAVASGLCSAAETMLWCYAKEKFARRYCALRFEANLQFTRDRPSWTEYYEQFLSKGQDLGVLTESDVEWIKRTGGTKMLTYGELNKYH